MGRQGGEAVQAMIASASDQNRSGWAGAVGLITLVVTASGVFSELQAALNAGVPSRPRGPSRVWFGLGWSASGW
jgi:membrane protein